MPIDHIHMEVMLAFWIENVWWQRAGISLTQWQDVRCMIMVKIWAYWAHQRFWTREPRRRDKFVDRQFLTYY